MLMSMIRKQLFLDEDLDRALKGVAKSTGRSEAAVVRDALRAYLAERLRRPATDPWLTLVGMVDGEGPTDAAINHDHYLYGAPKRQP